MYFTLHVKDKHTMIFRNISVSVKNSTYHDALEGGDGNPTFRFSLKSISLRESSTQFTAMHGGRSLNCLQLQEPHEAAPLMILNDRNVGGDLEVGITFFKVLQKITWEQRKYTWNLLEVDSQYRHL